MNIKPYSTRVRFSQRTRRCLVMVAYLSLLAYTLAWLFGSELRWAFISLYVVLQLILAYATGLLDGMPASYLDERQETLRNRAFRLAFVPVNYYIIGILLSISLANHWLQERFFIALVVALGLGIIMLPAAFIAWLEPDPIEENTPPSHELLR